MSTQLLSAPGKVHELCDDLESLWFVLLYEGLHFVKHNKPHRISLAEIFDHEMITGEIHYGGLGKSNMYANRVALMTKWLEFDSKPFTALVRQFYLLFKSLHGSYQTLELGEPLTEPVKQDLEKLKSCTEIKGLLKKSLESGEWPPTCDKVEDQYPRTERLTHQQKEAVALSYANHSLVPSGTHSGEKRKRFGEDDRLALNEAKRSKTSLLM